MVKLEELLSALQSKNNEKNKNTLLWVLAIIGAVAAVAGIVFWVATIHCDALQATAVRECPRTDRGEGVTDVQGRQAAAVLKSAAPYTCHAVLILFIYDRGGDIYITRVFINNIGKTNNFIFCLNTIMLWRFKI